MPHTPQDDNHELRVPLLAAEEEHAEIVSAGSGVPAPEDIETGGARAEGEGVLAVEAEEAPLQVRWLLQRGAAAWLQGARLDGRAPLRLRRGRRHPHTCTRAHAYCLTALQAGHSLSSAAAAAEAGHGAVDTPALTHTPSAIRPCLHASQLPGPPLVALYFLDLVRLLIFYWAIAADALLLKVRSARRPRACRMGAGREGRVEWAWGGGGALGRGVPSRKAAGPKAAAGGRQQGSSRQAALGSACGEGRAGGAGGARMPRRPGPVCNPPGGARTR
jgi:hypothetical protein